MDKPKISLHGVYKLEYDDELIEYAIQQKYGNEYVKDEEYREYVLNELDHAYLIELLIENPDEKFDLSDIKQPDNDQAAYDEYYFSTDYKENFKYSVPELDKFKVLFWFHYFEVEKPLLHSYGNMIITKIDKMPELFKKIKPYFPVD